MAAIGVIGSYSITPHWSVDVGTGISWFAYRLGSQIRFNILQNNFTPFVALSAYMTSTLGGDQYYYGKTPADADDGEFVINQDKRVQMPFLA